MVGDKTEKLHILAVLGDGVSRNAVEILVLLEKNFGLKLRINALRKDLFVCYRQGLLVREKVRGVRRSYHYKISERGRGRLAISRAKKRKLEVVADLSRCPSEHKIDDRWFEVVGSLKTCDDLLKCCSSRVNFDSARLMGSYWQIELVKMIPNLPSYLLHLTDHMFFQDTFFGGLTIGDLQAVASRISLLLSTRKEGNRKIQEPL